MTSDLFFRLDIVNEYFHFQFVSILDTPHQLLQMTDSGDCQPNFNEFGQPVGFAMGNWNASPFPPHKTLTGRYCQIKPLKADLHAQDLWAAQSDDPNGARWTYLPGGPFTSFVAFENWCQEGENSHDPQFYAIMVNGQAVGVTAYLRIDPIHGVIEIGHIYYSSCFSKTCAATEAMYLLAANAFQLGYRHCEWKCDSFNEPSRKAATRLGFTFEGTFHQLIVYKGRNRDTSWFSIIDKDWNGGLKSAFERWLDTHNFDENGQQKLKLSTLTAPFVQATS